MKPEAFKLAIAWVCLVAYSVVGVVGSRGLVLCFGPEGHVAIEVAERGDCAGCVAPGDASPVAGRGGSFDTLPACPCDDVALAGGWQLVQRRDSQRALDVELQVPVASPAFALLPLAGRAPRLLIDRFARANQAATARPRGVVLLV